MRNIFDQYNQPENRLTHSLASALHQDSMMLKQFLAAFGPKRAPPVAQLTVIEQSLPGRPEPTDGETESQGLPDALIFSEDGWALVIESKVNDVLTKNQLRRHQRTVERCGFENISGLAITLWEPRFTLDGWRMVTWKDIYSWAGVHKNSSQWASFLVDYFNIAEARMAGDEYLKEGTITEFAGISFDPYTYLEGKRVLRLLTEKIRGNNSFMEDMGLDPASGRSSITDQPRLWDFVSFSAPGGEDVPFQEFPHCTVSVGPVDASAMITFPHGMRPALRKKLHGESFQEFANRLQQSSAALTRSLKGFKAYRPMVRVMQRRYKTQRSIPMMDGRVEFDLRSTFGDLKPGYGPPIKKQPQWARAAYELLVNKHSNIQFQIGVEFYYPNFDELADKNADRHFMAVFKALRPFASPVID